ncbi:hypothetical protein NDU88_003503 [Pleurodeles waltl]|uniref:Uncharacterized protein n=1 Tax=Pleurodeles waltl TaxID=8319 RepID=A0AAV7LIQ8_PLEWA|nr:hypothetical protein NDU88_003503 [Pleurodeles waltl]
MTADRPRLLITCFLPHVYVRQILTSACTHGPYEYEGHKSHIMGKYSRETNDKSQTFLALRPAMRKCDIKYGLHECMWITMDGHSKVTSRLFLTPLNLAWVLSDPPVSLPPNGGPARPRPLGQQRRLDRLQERFFLAPSSTAKSRAIRMVMELTKRSGRDKSSSPLKDAETPSPAEDNWKSPCPTMTPVGYGVLIFLILRCWGRLPDMDFILHVGPPFTCSWPTTSS